MADISLREYLAKLDSLLSNNSAPEVILHARHILQHFPRNAQTYRLLGRSLVATTRWPEAAEVMRRVLSVFPDDKDAHAGLSEVYRLEKRADDAIWHLERAFEQSPNDQTILDKLRDLYRKHRKVEHGKVQLTAGAVARQYVRNGLYEQALDTLQKAIAATPERVDLRLLLAQTYWDAGRRVEAGETALEVLRTLPDCLIANTLMAALWLTESRPSDAQRYINRLQSLDPYLALELAQGQDVLDESFKLSELDYQKAAERELVAQTPDWLKGIDAATAAAMSANLDSQANAADILAGEGLRRSRTTEQEIFDDLGETDGLFDDQPPGEPAASRTALTNRLNKPPTGSLVGDRPVPGPKKGLTGQLTPPPEERLQSEPLPSFMADLMSAEAMAGEDSIPPTDIDMPVQADLPDWIQAGATTESATEADELPFRRPRSQETDHNDPLAWLRDSGIEVAEEAAPADDDLFGAADDSFALQDADAVDPLSWMQGYGGKDMLVDSTEATANETRLMDNELPGDDDSDPLSWLQQVDVEPTPLANPTPEKGSDDPLDWLSDDTLLDEALNLESLVDSQVIPSEPLASAPAVSPTAAMPEWQDIMPDEQDPLDWLSSSEAQPEPQPDESFTWSDQPATAEASTGDEEFPDWMTRSDEEPLSLETDDVSPSDNLDWMSSMPPTESESTQPIVPAGTGILDWLNKSAPETASLPTTPSASDIVPDWLNDMQSEIEVEPSTPVVDENGFEWMSKADTMPSAVTADSSSPDWMNELNMADEAAALGEDAPLAAAEVPDWLTQTQMGDESLVEAAAASESVANWMGELNIEHGTEVRPAEDITAVGDTPQWANEMEMGEDAPLPIKNDTPDWLAALQPEDEIVPEAEPQAVITDAPNWLTAMQPEDQAVVESEPEAVMSDAPDWLTAMQPEDQAVVESEPEAVMSDTPDWLAGLQPEDEVVPEAEPHTVITDTPDWLTAMQSEGEMADAAEPEAAMSDAPDWLTAMQPEDQAVVESEPEAVMSDTPDWLASLQPEDEMVAEAEPEAVMSDTPDWLAGLQPEDEMVAEAEPEPVISDAPDWLTAMQPEDQAVVESEPEAVMSDTPDWLAGLQPEDEMVAEAEPEAVISDAPDWLTAMQSEGEMAGAAEPEAVITDRPDWLAGLQPEDEMVAEAEPEAVMSDTPDWLATMQSEGEVVPEAEPEATMSDTPDWLATTQPEGEVIDTPALPMQRPVSSAMTRDLTDWTGGPDFESGAVTNDEPDWLTDMATDAVPEPTVDAMMADYDDINPMDEADTPYASDMPDWLTAMRPAEASTTIDEQQSDYQWEAEPADGEAMPGAPAPARNAPDWLNAMVPGLDVDYDAPEDEPLETEFLAGSENRVTPIIPSAPPKTRPEYGWLLDIVQEESQHIGTMGQQAARRFVFSRPPAWLRTPTEVRDESAGQEDADNVDIPPWLQ